MIKTVKELREFLATKPDDMMVFTYDNYGRCRSSNPKVEVVSVRVERDGSFSTWNPVPNSEEAWHPPDDLYARGKKALIL